MYIERSIFSSLIGQKDNKKITILVGARQVGKTTLLTALFETLKAEHPSLFLDLDLYSNYEKVSTYENLINTLRLNGYDTRQDIPFILYLDEFQRYTDISQVIKNIVDHHPNIKIYASGSSSLAINSNIQESLAGRKRTIRVFPLSFYEFLKFRKQHELVEKLNRMSAIRSENIESILPEIYPQLEEFLIFGGYPEVALAEPKDRKEVFNGIFDLYVKKDLVDYLKVEKIKNAKLLIQTLAVNNGCETKYSSLGQLSGLDEKTIKNYLEILKETFLVSVHAPWFRNRNKEIVKMPKVYYLDNGVRNYFVNNFNILKLRADAAYLFEGYVISELLKKGVPADNIKFWRTKSQIEVDMILDCGEKPLPVEIKYKRKLSKKDISGLNSFRSHYPDVDRSYLVNLTDNTSIGNTILLSPFHLDALAQDWR